MGKRRPQRNAKTNDVLPGNAAMSGSVALRAARGLGHGLARQAG